MQISDILKSAISNITAPFKKSLNQELRRQNEEHDPNNIYACFFACCLMFFSYKLNKRLKYSEYRRACIRAGAMRDDFYILNHQKMAEAAGCNLIARNQIKNLREKIFELLLKETPVIFSLGNEHYESIDGYEVTDGNLLFTIDDPGFQGDKFCDPETLEVFKIQDNKRIYSKGHRSITRRITKIYWYE